MKNAKHSTNSHLHNIIIVNKDIKRQNKMSNKCAFASTELKYSMFTPTKL